MWGREESNLGHLAEKHMLRSPHEVGHPRISCFAPTILIARIQRVKTNGASQSSRFESATFFLLFLPLFPVSISLDFNKPETFLGTEPSDLLRHICNRFKLPAQVILFQLKHQFGRPEIHLLSVSKKIFSGSKCPKDQVDLLLITEAVAGTALCPVSKLAFVNVNMC